tara:strand:- start:2993 stop:3301 length:309 start_codon:yes stop_codon:yes gene_type:complete
MIKKIKDISKFLATEDNSDISIKQIRMWYVKLNRLLKIRSCFVNSLAQKIIFSFFGYDLSVICGIKFDNQSNFKGHAWLSYKNQIIFEENNKIQDYVESFKV